MDRRAYWIWLQQAFGPGSHKPAAIDRLYDGGAAEFLEGGPRLWYSRHHFTERELSGLRAFSLTEAEARLEYALRVGWQVLTPDSEAYPQLLRNIYAPPTVLYVKGDLPPVDAMATVAIVGARKAADRSLDAARSFGYQLALSGACVVSGGAAGVDAKALSGALEIPGARVISVLPVSLDSAYVQKNAKLRKNITERRGALVTEYFSQQNPDFGTFPVRNRLITGLSHGVLLIQAAAKSGTYMYARLALEQDRDVFVLPGEKDDPAFAGSNALLADGAKPVRTGEDIFSEYRHLLGGGPALADPVMPRTLPAPEPLVRVAAVPVLSDAGADLSAPAQSVLGALENEPLSIAQLEEKTGLSASHLLGLLTQLELEGLAESLPGKRYRRGRG